MPSIWLVKRLSMGRMSVPKGKRANNTDVSVIYSYGTRHRCGHSVVQITIHYCNSSSEKEKKAMDDVLKAVKRLKDVTALS